MALVSNAIVCQFETGAVSQHVRVDRKADSGHHPQPGEHLAKTRRGARGSFEARRFRTSHSEIPKKRNARTYATTGRFQLHGGKKERARHHWHRAQGQKERKEPAPVVKGLAGITLTLKCGASGSAEILPYVARKSPGSGGEAPGTVKRRVHNRLRPNQPNMVIRMQRRSACSSTCESPS